eukprot:g1291.t1
MRRRLQRVRVRGGQRHNRAQRQKEKTLAESASSAWAKVSGAGAALAAMRDVEKVKDLEEEVELKRNCFLVTAPRQEAWTFAPQIDMRVIRGDPRRGRAAPREDHKHAHVPQRRNPLQQQQGRWKPRQLVRAVVDEEFEDSAAWDQLDQTYYEAEDVTEDWFDDPDDTYWQDDDEAFFYDATSVDDSSLFDTEEFDQVYAAYTDAKQRMQQLRQSRGFYPVVAMVDQRQMPLGSSTTPRSPSPPSGKKGKGKKPKGKSTTSSSSGKGPTGKARAKDAMAGMPETRTCLRCGKVGHLAANCQTKTGSPKKRVLEDGDPLLAGMVFHQEHLQFEDAVEDLEQPVFYDAEEAYAQGEQLVRAGGWLTERADTAIQDQGASSFLMGTEYLLRYIRWLAAKGFDVSQLEFKRCDKAFRFGGDAEGHSRWMISLPVLIEGVPGRIQSYVIFGATPMLLGRPVLEKLQTIVDFGDNRMRIMGGPWKEIERGKQGAMLLPLCQNLHEADQLSQPVFDLRSEDDHAESATLHEFLKDLNAEQRYEEMKSEVEGLADDGPQAEEKEGVEKTIESLEKFFVCCEHQLQEIKKKQSQMLQEARPEARRRKLVWEVYAGRGRVSEECARSGAEVMRFGLDDGWDFTKAKHRRALLSMQQELEPDEVFISPKCTLWSPMQNINVRNEEDAQALREKQWEDHEIHLKFARRLYLQQAKHGRHAHIERPAPSKAWSTPAFKNHCWSRDSTYVLNVQELPFDLKQTDLQATNGLTMINGQKKIYVNDSETYMVGKGQWHGKTLFPLTKAAATCRRMPYAGDLESKVQNRWTLRGRGHVWTAVGVTKKRKEKDDLREGRVKLEDRLAFVEGKKAELASIFENGVWEIECHPERVDHARVMKARFVLKWTMDQKGNPRAKARLVLQGFSDPDLLQGSLETSSPTLSRISRQMLLAIAVNEGWSKFTADEMKEMNATGKAREALKKEFNFKHWTTDEKGELEFCGNKLTKGDDESWRLQQEDYLKKIKPMSTVKKNEEEELRGREARKEEEEDEEMMEESGVQTEEAPRAPPRVEDKTTKLEAKIEQYRDFIRRGNLVNQDLRSTIDDLRTEIEERQMRQDRTDQELGRHQRMIAEIERELQEVRRQAEAARSNLAGIPSRVFISRRGEKYHLRPDCNGMNNATAIRHVDYCSFCSQQVMSTPSMFVPHQDVGRPT